MTSLTAQYIYSLPLLAMTPILQEPFITNRINTIDILRGFALYGIVLAHVASVYLYEFRIMPAELTGIDGKLKRLLEFFIERKFYLIFSFLFGLSFSIQFQNALHRKKNFVLKYCWRLGILFFIGFIHNQFYPFDILQVYAIIGVLLLPIRKFSPSTLLTIAVTFFIFSCLFQHFDNPIKNALTIWRFHKVGLSTTFTHQFVSGNHFMIVCMFVLGLWAGKKKIFSYKGIDTSFFKILLLCSLITLISVKVINDLIDISSIDVSAINICFSFLYISCICLLYTYFPNMKLLWKSLEAIGRMGLTNYILQTIFFFSLFQFYDLPLNEGGLYLLFIYANFFFLFQALISIAWFKRYPFGPIEWLWRITTNLYKETSDMQKTSCKTELK
jgi:uncharacterized protein